MDRRKSKASIKANLKNNRINYRRFKAMLIADKNNTSYSDKARLEARRVANYL